jgi:hypothetical protein
MSPQLPGPSVAVSIGARVYPMSVPACIEFNAMLVSHGPLKNVPHGELRKRNHGLVDNSSSDHACIMCTWLVTSASPGVI